MFFIMIVACKEIGSIRNRTHADEHLSDAWCCFAAVYCRVVSVLFQVTPHHTGSLFLPFPSEHFRLTDFLFFLLSEI
jgi:hypothetical protein